MTLSGQRLLFMQGDYTAHPFVAGAAGIFEETGEPIGCEQIMVDRAATPELAESFPRAVCIRLTSCRMARCASASGTSTTTPRLPR